MRILLIGNFAPPYEEENLHNFTLLNLLRQEGNNCCVINTSDNPSQEKGIINTKNYFDFVVKLIRYGWKRDVIHVLTKGYTRVALLRFMTAILFGRFLLAKPIGTLHSEMFSVFVQSRSPVGGMQATYASFSLADKIICSDKHTYLASTKYKIRNNFEIIPSFVQIPQGIKEDELLKKLKAKKRIILFSNVRHPSFSFDILNNFLTKHLNHDIGIVVSLCGESLTKLKDLLVEKAGDRATDNLVFIDPDNIQLLLMAYDRADLILKTLSCDGKPLFEEIALIARRRARSGNCLYFPGGLLLIREGEVEDSCAYIFNILLEKTQALPSPTEDFYMRIKDIYEST